MLSTVSQVFDQEESLLEVLHTETPVLIKTRVVLIVEGDAEELARIPGLRRGVQ
jgi:hypothetical protein